MRPPGVEGEKKQEAPKFEGAKMGPEEIDAFLKQTVDISVDAANQQRIGETAKYNKMMERIAAQTGNDAPKGLWAKINKKVDDLIAKFRGETDALRPSSIPVEKGSPSFKEMIDPSNKDWSDPKPATAHDMMTKEEWRLPSEKSTVTSEESVKPERFPDADPVFWNAKEKQNTEAYLTAVDDTDKAFNEMQKAVRELKKLDPKSDAWTAKAGEVNQREDAWNNKKTGIKEMYTNLGNLVEVLDNYTTGTKAGREILRKQIKGERQPLVLVETPDSKLTNGKEIPTDELKTDLKDKKVAA